MFQQVQSFVWANQWLVPIILWFVIGLVSWALKPRTQAQYDKMNPRIAALLVALGGVANLPKIVEYLRRVITGWATPARTTALVTLCTFGLGLHAIACANTHASPADFGITDESIAHGAAIKQCLADARDNIRLKLPNVCAIYNECQQGVARKYGAQIGRASCRERV